MYVCLKLLADNNIGNAENTVEKETSESFHQAEPVDVRLEIDVTGVLEKELEADERHDDEHGPSETAELPVEEREPPELLHEPNDEQNEPERALEDEPSEAANN